MNISADWLADEIGEMTCTTYGTHDPKLIALCKVMEEQPEYIKDAAMKEIAALVELVERARANGTDHG